MKEEFDIVITNGIIVDGSGKEPFRAAIGIKDGIIVHVGKLSSFDAREVIDAKDMIVCPGFIDMHSHGDETLFLYPDAINFLLQGITTIVGGNCGFSPAPLRDWWLVSFWDFDLISEIRPFKYYPDTVIPLDEFKAKIKEKYGVNITWRTFKEYFNYLERLGIGVNYVPQVGHNTIRAQVLGPDFKREASKREIEEMKTLVEEAFVDGVWGFSTGLDYEPGAYASKEELIELLKVVAKYEGIYSTHWRRTGVRKERTEFSIPEKIKGIEEAIELASTAKVKLEISHLLSGYTIYPIPPKELAVAAIKATLKIIDEARSKGLDVSFDVIPNTTGGVFTFKYLVDFLAPWVRELGSREALSKALKMKDFRNEIKRIINEGKWWYINPKVDPYWSMKILILKHINEKYSGKTIYEVSKELNKDPLEVLFDLIIEDPYARATYRSLMYEDEVIELIKHPLSMICTDVFSVDYKWELKSIPSFLPHPNTYGSFPRFIKRYVYELKVLSIESAIKKITYMPARKLGLQKRGLIKQGYYADIVIFNPRNIGFKGNELEPRVPPDGIMYVIVNGAITVKEGKYLGIRKGVIIKRREREVS